MAKTLVTITLPLESWQSVIRCINNAEMEYPEKNVIPAFTEALCPDGHTEETQIRMNKWSVYPDKIFIWANASCSVCYTYLWGLWHDDVSKDTYKFHDELTKKQVTFKPGGKKDPNKIDIPKLIASRKYHSEWRKL
jgi:hypothetical protein